MDRKFNKRDYSVDGNYRLGALGFFHCIYLLRHFCKGRSGRRCFQSVSSKHLNFPRKFSVQTLKFFNGEKTLHLLIFSLKIHRLECEKCSEKNSFKSLKMNKFFTCNSHQLCREKFFCLKREFS